MEKGFALLTQYCAKITFLTVRTKFFLIDVKEGLSVYSICIFAY
jgi:hypothetical protein